MLFFFARSGKRIFGNRSILSAMSETVAPSPPVYSISQAAERTHEHRKRFLDACLTLTMVRWVKFKQNQRLRKMYSRQIDRGMVGAKWREDQTLEEKQELEVIERRLALKYASIEELLAKKKVLMRRAIERGRREARGCR